ncbi:alpha-1,3/alpha-1,6-mannosyltransferase [Strigomonas culicis]|nr:alpha-1,3/alpha-1,6-mannosyltransferase [Strigomonas culicis]|eukprot:EPY23060.1 alpha-1,3/alpha-1,6-mannosyltransferase [Strigomonas culicis]
MQTRLRIHQAYKDKAKARKEQDGAAAKKRRLKVVFLHPDLGIGGAERLVVDAAVSLQNQTLVPVEVTVVTNFHDPKRAFVETTDGTLKVLVRGRTNFPASIFGRAKALCADVRMMYAALSVCWTHYDTDAFVVDQVSAAMLVLSYFAPYTPRIFYCHFPDLMCDSNRKEDGTLVSAAPGHKTYRGMMDALEGAGMSMATCILCNSIFSRGVTVSTFPYVESLVDKRPLYPPVTPKADLPDLSKLDDRLRGMLERVQSHTTFVSINRYERKKNIGLAIEAFHKATQQEGVAWPKPPLLVVAGGYDNRLDENVSYGEELQKLARDTLQLSEDQVLFLRNISAATKEFLLTHMFALVYTPAMEHFGIAPVEAMLRARPVIAVNHGGPCESVMDVQKHPEEAAGILCAPTADAFAEAMLTLVKDEELAAKLSQQGERRATTVFSVAHCGDELAKRLELECNASMEKIIADLDAEAAQGGNTVPTEKKSH